MGIYVHLPFCRTRCLYCDFYSTTNLNNIPRVVSSIVLEIERRATDMIYRVDTIYFGGGTPSLLEPVDVGRILETLEKRFVLEPGAEITIEVNPDSVSRGNLKTYRSLGINRLNIGIQSFKDPLLKRLGRCHRAHQGLRALDLAFETGFENVGVDLIYGIPGQSSQIWENDLAAALSWPISHISAYALTYEPGTPLATARDQGLETEQPEKDLANLYQLTHVKLLKAGWHHYEISNYARSTNFTSRHNQKYWRGMPYLGFGPAAHSFDGSRRQWNLANVTGYLEHIVTERSAVAGEEHLNSQDHITETLMLGLRCAEGVDLKALEKMSGVSLIEKTSQLRQRLVEEKLLITQSGFQVSPTARGMLVADAMARSFLKCLE